MVGQLLDIRCQFKLGASLSSVSPRELFRALNRWTCFAESACERSSRHKIIYQAMCFQATRALKLQAFLHTARSSFLPLYIYIRLSGKKTFFDFILKLLLFFRLRYLDFWTLTLELEIAYLRAFKFEELLFHKKSSRWLIEDLYVDFTKRVNFVPWSCDSLFGYPLM